MYTLPLLLLRDRIEEKKRVGDNYGLWGPSVFPDADCVIRQLTKCVVLFPLLLPLSLPLQRNPVILSIFLCVEEESAERASEALFCSAERDRETERESDDLQV